MLKGMNSRPAKKPLLAVKTSAQWCTYFQNNARRRISIPWQEGLGDAREALMEILPSLRGWQLGESSDGAHLRKAAQHYAAKVQDPEFLRVIEWFIAEEQRHGAELGRLLDLAGVPRATSNWGDGLFRAARHALPSMEVWTTPVVMIETLALLYYHALHQATPCGILRRLCAQILRDEVPHIRFQCERLAILQRRRRHWLRVLTMGLHRVFFAGTVLAVWVGHRRALKAGGYGFAHFWRCAWTRMNHAWRLMDPRVYAWHEEAPEEKSPPGSKRRPRFWFLQTG